MWKRWSDWPCARSPAARAGKGSTIHEAGIAQNILRIVEGAALDNGLSFVQRVVLEIGSFSGVDATALEFALNVLRRGTVLASAEVEYQVPPLVLYCRDCEDEYVADVEDLACPACTGRQFDVVQGRELRVKTIAGGQDGGCSHEA